MSAERDGWMIFAVEDGVVHWRDSQIWLTEQEAKALYLLCMNYKHWMTKRDIADYLWPAELPNNSDWLVERTMRKLASKIITDRTRIELRKGYGYSLSGDIDWIHVVKVMPTETLVKIKEVVNPS